MNIKLLTLCLLTLSCNLHAKNTKDVKVTEQNRQKWQELMKNTKPTTGKAEVKAPARRR